MNPQNDKVGKAQPTEVSMLDLILENKRLKAENFKLSQRLKELEFRMAGLEK